MSTILELKDLPSQSNDEVWYFPAGNTFEVIEISDSLWKVIKTKLLLVGSVKVTAPIYSQLGDYDFHKEGNYDGVRASFPDEFYKGYNCRSSSDEAAFIFYSAEEEP